MMKIKMVDHLLCVKCLSCHKENLETIEIKYDNGTGQLLNLCKDCREKMINFLKENN